MHVARTRRPRQSADAFVPDQQGAHLGPQVRQSQDLVEALLLVDQSRIDGEGTIRSQPAERGSSLSRGAPIRRARRRLGDEDTILATRPAIAPARESDEGHPCIAGGARCG